jgi:hypothetical protein
MKVSSKTANWTLIIQFTDQRNPIARHSYDNTRPAKRNPQTARTRLVDVFLKSGKYNWVWAFMRNNRTGAIECYYHNSTGAKELSKSAYALKTNSTNYNLYIIPKTHSQKPTTIKDCILQEVPQYFSADVAKIQLYRGKQLKYIYDGEFKEVA